MFDSDLRLSTMMAELQTDRDALIALFGRDRSTHIYGLADLEEQYWSRSKWWLRGDAAVGLIGIPGSNTSVVYAVSAADPLGTKSLLADLAAVGDLPQEFVITGPTGMASALSPSRRIDWVAAHRKMLLVSRSEPIPHSHLEPKSLGMNDAASIGTLRANDPDAGGFFYPGLLEVGPYLGIFIGGELVAMAGVHVASHQYDVVAVGNVFTHPDHRGRGLAATLMVRLLKELRSEFGSVGLNVEEANQGAIRLYERLGFEQVMDYDEAVVSGIHG